jgi:hypothetical protein
MKLDTWVHGASEDALSWSEGVKKAAFVQVLLFCELLG